MHSFIALAKKSNLQTANPGTLSVDDKQQPQRDNSKLFSKFMDAITQKITETLTLLGFKQVIHDVSSLNEQTLDDAQTSNFIPLDYLGAYVVNSSDKEKIKEAQKSIDKADYEIVPDVQLSLPKPTRAGEVFRRRKQILWPAESGIRQAHKDDIIGKGVLVGVLDTGCDADHIQLRQKRIDFRYVPHHSESDNLREVRGFDVDGHGTHVCGIIAGRHIGVAPGADLMVVSVIESETLKTSLSRIYRGLDWMLSQISSEENINKPVIVNMSLGFITEHLENSEKESLMVGVRGLLSTLVEDYNVLPVVAIGNEGPGNMRAPGYFPETLSVGAVDFNHKLACFSGGGQSPTDGKKQPNIVGYGVDIFSSLERDRNNRSSYICMSGTSMATPYVAGIAALCASGDANLQGEALRQHLLNTALPLQAPADRVGAGLARFTENGNKNP